MVEVRILGDSRYRAAWDTYEEARADLLSHIVPAMERKLRSLRNEGIVIDTEYYFNKRGRLRKAIKESDEELRSIASILWLHDPKGLQWYLKKIE